MIFLKKQIAIIGAGPAGLAAAVAAYDAGATDIVIVERDECAGGILNQCVHNGFGLHTFKEELTGPEYAARFEKMTGERNIECMFGTTALSVGADKTVVAVNSRGMLKIEATAVILACGCRERPRGGVNIAGTRPSGVYSAGTAQRLINIDGEHIGDDVFMLGSGDIGLIMARRMIFEGARVHGVAELMPYSSGLKRNIVQCLNDFDIPLMLSSTVVEIRGRERISSVVVADVVNKKPIMSTACEIKCDTLLLSVGLLPENELARGAGIKMCAQTGGATVNDSFMTSIDGIFMCGNCLHVHDLVDYVSKESAQAGLSAALYVAGKAKRQTEYTPVETSGGVRYSVPQKISREGGAITLRMRVGGVYKNATLVVRADGKDVYSKKRPIVTPGEMETLELSESVSGVLRSSNKIEIALVK